LLRPAVCLGPRFACACLPAFGRARQKCIQFACSTLSVSTDRPREWCNVLDSVNDLNENFPAATCSSFCFNKVRTTYWVYSKGESTAIYSTVSPAPGRFQVSWLSLQDWCQVPGIIKSLKLWNPFRVPPSLSSATFLKQKALQSENSHTAIDTS